MNNRKRGMTKPVYNEDLQSTKRAKTSRPKIRKPVPSYFEMGQFGLELERFQNRFCYDWLRRSSFESGRPLFLPYEPFHFNHQTTPGMAYHGTFDHRGNLTPYQMKTSNSTHSFPSIPDESFCKTKIFDPVANGVYMERSGGEKGKVTKEIGDDRVIWCNVPRSQTEFYDGADVDKHRHDRREKSVDENSHQSLQQNKNCQDGEARNKMWEEKRKSHEIKPEQFCNNETILIDTERPGTPKLSETSKEEDKKDGVMVAKDDVESNAEGNTGPNRNRKIRRKAFTLANNLMEKIVDTSKEEKATGNVKTSRNEMKLEKCQDERNGETVACKVFGLMSLQGSRERRYDITVEELRRRVSAPEHLNKVDMISYLRLAKNSARLLLEKYDIISSLHHRLSKHTILSKVSESECEDLATGIHDINMSYFPCRAVAQKSVTRIKEEEKTERGEKEQLEKRCKDLQTTRSVLMEMCATLSSMHDDKNIDDFKNITHTFGIQNLSNHIQFFNKYFKEEEKHILDTLKND